MFGAMMSPDDSEVRPDQQSEALAKELIENHGCDQAAVEAAHQARACVNEGDQAACQKWLEVLTAIRTWYDAPPSGPPSGIVT